MNKRLPQLISEYSDSGLLKWENLKNLAFKTGMSTKDLEDMALTRGIVPLRYLRNISSISHEEQQLLSRSRVTVIGCGGLGGYIVEELARLGIGTISAWDFDSFEEHNLNRQLLAEMDSIGQSKVDTAAKRVKAINPGVNFRGIYKSFSNEAETILSSEQVIVDALDNVVSRLELARICRDLEIPLVHGAVEGWYGQVATQFPGENLIEQIYEQLEQASEEKNKSTLAFVPALVASLQAAEITKILLGRGELLRGRLMLIDLLDMDMEIIEISS